MSKNAKEDAPLTGFIEYFAYKLEERKYNLQYSTPGDQANQSRLKDVQPILPPKAFAEYTTEKMFDKREYYIGREDYLKIEFEN